MDKLTIQQWTRLIGGKAKKDVLGKKTILDIDPFFILRLGMGGADLFKPILRSFDQMSKDDVEEFMKIDSWGMRYDSIIIWGGTYGLKLGGEIMSTHDCRIEHHDYLDSIRIDIRDYIGKGLAVREESCE